MKIAIPKECRPGERRVAATPETSSRLIKLGFEVPVELDAGAGAILWRRRLRGGRGDDRSRHSRSSGRTADIVLKVQPPDQHPALGVHEADLIRPGATLISFLWPGKNKALVERLAAAQGHGDRHRSGAAHHARAEDGRAVVDGQHRRLSRSHRSGELLRPILHRPDDRRRASAAGQGSGDWRGRRRVGSNRRGARTGRDCARVRHAIGGSRPGQERGRRVPRGPDRRRGRRRRRLCARR